MTAGRTINTLSQQWCTPQKYINAIDEMFNYYIQLDPCSNEDSIVNAETIFILPETDGLKQSWNYETIFVNPPYGRDKQRKTTIKDWIKKVYNTYETYNSEILVLIPVATNTSHWKQYIFGKATGICFLYDTRLKFRINGSEDNKGCPMACAMIYYGKDYDKFYEIFNEFGYISK